MQRCMAALMVVLIAVLVAPAAALAATVVGSDQVQSYTDTNSSGQAEAFRAVASASGTFDTLHVYLDSTNTAARVEVGIYTNSASKPASKVASCSISPTQIGWNSCSASGSVTSGTTYWTAVLRPTDTSGTIRFRSATNGGTAYTTTSSSLSALPSTFAAGSQWPSSPASIYASSTSPADSAPYAKVYDSSNNLVAQYGTAYASAPGGQVQVALNKAECNSTSACSTTGSATYPKVKLDSGTFSISTPFGLTTSPQECAGIFAYADVELYGVSGTLIDNAASSSYPCGGTRPSMDALILVAANPGNLATWGSKLNLHDLSLNVRNKAHYGVLARKLSGSNLNVGGIQVTNSNSGGIDVGAGDQVSVDGTVIGTSGSPVSVINNTVTNSADDGILVGGSWVKAAGNTVNSFNNHGIAIFSGATHTNIEVSANTIDGSSYLGFNAISIDGSSVVGTSNSVYNNTITNTCVGVFVFRQSWANVAGNYIANPYRTYKNSCHGFEGHSVGIAVKDSNNNFFWSNQVWHYGIGGWTIDADPGASPGGYGTHWNNWGVQPGPWPYTVAGNWIVDADYGFAVEEWASPGGNTYNEFEGNSVSSSTYGCVAGGAVQAVGYIAANSFASCP